MRKIKIVGGEAEVEDVEAFLSRMMEIARRHGVVIQAMDADKIAGEEHILSAVKKAFRAKEKGKMRTNNIGLEILLYASGRRHVEKAIEMGISKGQKNVALVIVGTEDDDIEKASEEISRRLVKNVKKEVIEYRECKKEQIMDFFEIKKDELDAVGDKISKLVLERVAMLDVMS